MTGQSEYQAFDDKSSYASIPICLLRPPTVTKINAVGQDGVPPIGLAYLAGALNKHGYETMGIDAVGEAVLQYTTLSDYQNALLHGLTNDQILERIPDNTQIICVSCMFSVEWPFIHPLLEQIREKLPNALIVVGGEHVKAASEFILDTCPAVDVCTLGEGEETIVELVDAYFTGGDFSTIAGLCIRWEGQNLKTAYRNRITNIDSIAEPNWEIFPVEEYIDNALTHGANLGRCMPILASRGCPYECTFCSSPQMWTRKWSARRPELVLAEMKKYIKRYNVTNFDFYDLTAIVRKDWIMEFCDLLIKEDLNITWQLPSGTRSEAIDEEVVEMLYKSGCRIMNYAPESGSEPELKRIKKKVDLRKMLISMSAAYKANIKIKCNFIFGLPGATWGDVRRTFGFLRKLARIGVDDISAFAFSPYPGTELFSNLIKENRIVMDKNYFESLLAYTDASQIRVSYNEHFSPKILGILNLTAMIYFYIFSWIHHPKKLFNAIKAIISKDTSTKLTMAIANIKRKANAHRKSKKLGVRTVIIQPTYKPKEITTVEDIPQETVQSSIIQ